MAVFFWGCKEGTPGLEVGSFKRIRVACFRQAFVFKVLSKELPYKNFRIFFLQTDFWLVICDHVMVIRF